MENSLKRALIISAVVHAGLVISFSLQLKKSAYITLPVQLYFYNSPSAPAATPVREVPKTPPLARPKDKDDVIIPKKSRSVPVRQEAPPAPKKEEAPGKSGEQSAAQSGMSSSPITIDAAKFPYAYYTNLVVKKIGRSWQWSTDFGRLKAVIFFRILRSGSIAIAEIKESSGDRLFDEQALRAVKLADPFPPLPDGYSGDDLGVFFEFSYKD